mgnify:CR=1 FL=1
MQLSRRQFSAALASLATLPAMAQNPPFPSKPIRIVLGLPSGGAADASVRQLAATLQPAVAHAFRVASKRRHAGVATTALTITGSSGAGTTSVTRTALGSRGAVTGPAPSRTSRRAR